MKRITLLSACLIMGMGLFAQQVTWKKNATGYWVWVDNKPQNNTSSTFVEDDLLVYDSVSTSTMVLTGFRNAKYDTELTGMFINTGKDAYYWRTNDKLYWLYKNGVQTTTNRAVWVDNDMLVYDTITKESLLLRNYGNAPVNKIFPAQSLGKHAGLHWKTNGTSYWFYREGNYIGGTRSFWLGDDLVVYDTIANKSYQLVAYKSATPNKIYPAAEIQSKDHLFFWQNNGSYWLYDKGNSITKGKSYWHGNDIVIYYPPTNTSYLLPDYTNQVGIRLNNAQVLSKTEHVWWFGEANSYWLFDRGEQVTESTWKSEGNNLVVTGTNGKEYLIKDFYTNKDMILRPVTVRGW